MTDKHKNYTTEQLIMVHQYLIELLDILKEDDPRWTLLMEMREEIRDEVHQERQKVEAYENALRIQNQWRDKLGLPLLED